MLKFLVAVVLFSSLSQNKNAAQDAPAAAEQKPAAASAQPSDNKAKVGLANPASVHCEKKGGTLEIRKGKKGEYGVCKFPNGRECEEWAFFRGKCSPDAEPAKASIRNPAEEPQK
jgi:putative hemolysin